LRKLDKLNPRIKRRYERYQEILSEREARRLALLEATQSEVEGDALTFQGTLESDNVHQLEGRDNKELAVQLAQDEMSRRASERKASRQAGTTQDDERPRRAAKGWDATDYREPDDLSRRLQEVRAQVEMSGRTPGQSLQRKEVDGTYSYPNVPSNHAIRNQESLTPSQRAQSSHVFQPPVLPPKSAIQPSISAPPLPEKHLSTPTPTTNISPAKSPPSKPTYTFAPSAYLENGNPLRTLFLPPTLRHSFLQLAAANTLANLETCAFLAGTLLSNALFISKLILPRQTSTADTCEMTHESDLFAYIDAVPDLIILGWIHTHPSQSCFMSSRDLHTHAAYQMMLPESVAVVCAPSKGDSADGGEWGVFRLTDPPGKRAILECEQPGIFHPHDVEGGLYTGALRPGHVVEAKGLEFEVVDLR
jgi:STAM-binding protein